MKIQQGDQYAIPIKIKCGETVITPANCTDVRIKIENKMLSYAGGEISFVTDDNTWCFPLTESISFTYENRISIQIAVKFDDDYVYSPVQQIDVGGSIIRELWHG